MQLFKGNKLSSLQPVREEGAQRARRQRPDADRIDDAAGRGDERLRHSAGWSTGPNPTYKFGDQWVLSDRLLLDVQYAHVGNNFILDFHDPLHDAAPTSVQPTLIISTTLNGRSTPDGSQSVNIRPVNSVTVNANYFLPGRLGGDHAFKLGGYWRDNDGDNSTHTPRQCGCALPDVGRAGESERLRARRRAAARCSSRATARPITS